ncbi:hypothetical protein [Brevibacillus sp. Leaf182]|uniref:hypothetical protein n=1 Tax=Brevibacillus sp. Leaf182 TaxID=1736290 RepID=UPI0006F3D66F|nr:hypothetical protein [Brevibacillus sp. Leaf182]RAT95705.1 hypothetical protein ASG16_023195 [Brevibacillus sp. Leaf182]
MNINCFLECEVCENKIHLKVYAGYVEFNPFSYYCPECGITIDGHILLNLSHGIIDRKFFNNAKEIPRESNVSHLLQVSSDFFTDKISGYNPTNPKLFFSPYMMNVVKHGGETTQLKASFAEIFTSNVQTDFNINHRIWQLYKKKKTKYLNAQLIKYKFVAPVILGQVLKVDHDDVILDVLYKPFKILLKQNGYYSEILDLRKELKKIKDKYPDQVLQLHLELKELINDMENSLVHLLENFVEFYKFIFPTILSSAFKTDDIEEIKNQQGILTTNFEQLKNYYVDAYEILCSGLVGFVGLQNIKLRGDRNSFHDEYRKSAKNITSIVEFIDKANNKGNRVKYFSTENIYNKFFDICSILNNGIRNSIGHYSYSYDTDQQLITFKDKSDEIKLYLVEFSDILYETFYGTIVSLEVFHFIKTCNK